MTKQFQVAAVDCWEQQRRFPTPHHFVWQRSLGMRVVANEWTIEMFLSKVLLKEPNVFGKVLFLWYLVYPQPESSFLSGLPTFSPAL